MLQLEFGRIIELVASSRCASHPACDGRLMPARVAAAGREEGAVPMTTSSGRRLGHSSDYLDALANPHV